MAEHAATTETTGTAHASAGFPPFKPESYPSQIFWLTVTFAFLFVVLWRIAGPRIHNAIALRRDRINSDLEAANAARGGAEGALLAYQTALAGAKKRAQALAEDARKSMHDEVERARAGAEARATADTEAAEAHINEVRIAARGNIVAAAEEASAAIVARLTGETVSPADAKAAVGAVKV